MKDKNTLDPYYRQKLIFGKDHHNRKNMED